ncbi:WD40 repeat domain-containing protein [Endozoicomonas ascidiicola]|uniref:WD40 repeat domain-containing protein n=1 Tax=Endozoicomonas ascidiicola TaxID=1698521 RepID=UPI00083598E9|nr:hypothetical protein [Endozoicomonas ascidiicola]
MQLTTLELQNIYLYKELFKMRELTEPTSLPGRQAFKSKLSPENQSDSNSSPSASFASHQVRSEGSPPERQIKTGNIPSAEGVTRLPAHFKPFEGHATPNNKLKLINYSIKNREQQESNPPELTFSDLNDDIINEIASYLPKSDFDNLRATNSKYGFSKVAGLRTTYLESCLKALAEQYYGDIQGELREIFAKKVKAHFDSNMDEAFELLKQLVPEQDFPTIQRLSRKNVLYLSSLFRMFSNNGDLAINVEDSTEGYCVFSSTLSSDDLMLYQFFQKESDSYCLKLADFSGEDIKIHEQTYSLKLDYYPPFLSLPDGKVATVASRNIHIFDLTKDKWTDKTKVLIGHFSRPISDLYVVSGSIIAACSGSSCKFFDTNRPDGHEYIRTLLHGEDEQFAQFHILPSGKWVTYGHNGFLKIWDSNNPVESECINIKASESVLRQVVNVGRNKQATRCGRGGLKIWDLDNSKDTTPLRILLPSNLTTKVNHLLVLPDGHLMANIITVTEDKDYLSIYDLSQPEGKELIKKIDLSKGDTIETLQILPDGRILAMGRARLSHDGRILLIIDPKKSAGSEIISRKVLDEDYRAVTPYALQVSKRLSRLVTPHPNYIQTLNYYSLL